MTTQGVGWPQEVGWPLVHSVRAAGRASVMLLGVNLLATTLVAALATATTCPSGLTLMESFGYPEEHSPATWIACEDLSDRDGRIVLIAAAAGTQPIVLPKRLESMYASINSSFTGGDMSALWKSTKDDMAIAFLANATAQKRDVSYDEIAAAVAPLVANGGADGGKESTKCGEKDGFGCTQTSGVHTFTGARNFLEDASFDSHGVDVNPGDFDFPSMNQHTGKYGVNPAVFKDKLVCSTEVPMQNCPPNATRAGLIGGSLPILHWSFERALDHSPNDGGWISQSVAPNPNSTLQTVLQIMFRFLKVDSQGKLLDSRYYDTIGYTGGVYSDQPHTETSRDFYRMLLKQHEYWRNTWTDEGLMSMELPSAPGTDGVMLADMTLHSLIRDMITRRGVDGPKYGVSPQTYGMVGAGGFQAIFVDDLTMSLELGAFKYATAILDNHMTNYVRRGGSILYRGLQMQSQGRTLTLLAMFHDYTGDPSGLLIKHFNKTAGIIGMLHKRRARALLLPKTDYAYGMPTGNDEADEGVTTFNCAVDFGGTLSPKLDYPNGECITELPYIPIVAEMVRGFTELGQLYVKLGKSSGHADMASSGARMLSEAAALKTDMLHNIERSSFPPPLNMPAEAGGPRGYPHVFGWQMMQGGPRNDTQMAHPPGGGGYKRPTLDVYLLRTIRHSDN